MGRKKKEVSYHTLIFICALAICLKPREKQTVTQWAEKNMNLPMGSNESGRYRVRNMPFQKAILDAITDPDVQDVSIMSSAQVGKTTIILCGIGYFAEYDPAAQMIVFPTLVLGQNFSKLRLASMIQDVPVLHKKIAPAKTKNSDNTILLKQYVGGYIVIAGANSPTSLSSYPARVIWMDEIDRFPESAGSEGNPVKLAETRATSFWNKKYIKTSTPTIAGDSKIEQEFNKGTMEEWCVQCPCCGTWQPYDFHRVVFETVSMTCAGCGEEIAEKDWKECNHKWIAAHPERKHHRSFHLNQLASPFVEWRKLIEDFNDAVERMEKYRDTEDLKTFINTKLGEVWDESEMGIENTVTDEALGCRAEYYKAEIPDGVILLTGAVDVQKNRFEVEIRGWARDYETWGIYKTEIYGNLEKGEVWDELEEYLSQTFYFKNGTGLDLAAFAVDTGNGNHTHMIYKWCKKMRDKGKPCYPVKGQADRPGLPFIYKRSEKEIKEKTKDGRIRVIGTTVLYVLGVDAGKDAILNRLGIEEPGEGYCHFPKNLGRGYDENYYKGLLSEHKVKKKVRGRIKDVWVKKNGVRNEPLDLFNYGYAALEIRKPAWDKLEGKLKKGINYMKQKKQAGNRHNRRKTVNGLEEW